VLPDVGIELLRKPGQEVSEGEAICRLYGHTAETIEQAVSTLEGAFDVRTGEDYPEKTMILDQHAEL
jgi:thymidine phosphorylase